MKKLFLPLFIFLLFVLLKFTLPSFKDEKMPKGIEECFVGKFKLDYSGLKEFYIPLKSDSVILEFKLNGDVLISDNTNDFFKGSTGKWTWLDTDMGYYINITIDNDFRHYTMRNIDPKTNRVNGMVYIDSLDNEFDLEGIFKRLK